jgi:hypothetical protein
MVDLVAAMRSLLLQNQFVTYASIVHDALVANQAAHANVLTVAWLPSSEYRGIAPSVFHSTRQWRWHLDTETSTAIVGHAGLSGITEVFGLDNDFPQGLELLVSQVLQPALDEYKVQARVAVGPKRTRIVFEFK